MGETYKLVYQAGTNYAGMQRFDFIGIVITMLVGGLFGFAAMVFYSIRTYKVRSVVTRSPGADSRRWPVDRASSIPILSLICLSQLSLVIV